MSNQTQTEKDAIYKCVNLNCSEVNKEFKGMNFKAYRFAIGRSPACFRCGMVVQYLRDNKQ